MITVIRRLMMFLAFLFTVALPTMVRAAEQDPFSLPPPPPPSGATKAPSTASNGGETKGAKGDTKVIRDPGARVKVTKAPTCAFGTVEDEESGEERCVTPDEFRESIVISMDKKIDEKSSEKATETIYFVLVVNIVLLLIIIFWTRSRVGKAVEAAEKAAQHARSVDEALNSAIQS